MEKGSEEELKENGQEEQEPDEFKESDTDETPPLSKNKQETGEASQIYAGYSHSRSSKKIPFLWGIVIIIFILGGAFYLFRAKSETQLKPNPLPKSVIPSVETTSPNPSPLSFDRSKYTLRVLNGTKRNGLAASVSASLKDLGYKVEKTANATNSAFLKTVVRVKPDLEELVENLLKDLMPDFEGKEEVELRDSDTVDGEIILGIE